MRVRRERCSEGLYLARTSGSKEARSSRESSRSALPPPRHDSPAWSCPPCPSATATHLRPPRKIRTTSETHDRFPHRRFPPCCARKCPGCQRHLQSRHFVHGRRQNHHRAFVERHVQLQPRSRITSSTVFSCGTRVATIESPTESGVDAAPPQSLDQRWCPGPPPALVFRASQAYKAPRRFPRRFGRIRTIAEIPTRDPASSRPVTKISFRPDCRSRSSAATVGFRHRAVVGQGSVIVRRQARCIS